MIEEEIKKFVDLSIESLELSDSLSIPNNNMPEEMRDLSKQLKSDWIPWKAIPSTVTDIQLAEIESKIGLPLPHLYKFFLKYKHFYELETIAEVNFFKHCVRDWQKTLLYEYYQISDPSEIIEKGFIPFAAYSDWGIICFDTNQMINGDCPIVNFDHETMEYNEEYGSFAEMMHELLKGLQEETNRSQIE